MRETLNALTFLLLLLLLASSSHAAEWEVLLEQADSISEAGYHDSAAVIGHRALELVEREFDSQDTVIAYVLERTGTYLNRFADYADAEKLFLRSLDIRENALSPDHPGVATSLLGLANSCRSLGKYDEAEPYLRRSLSIRENAYGQMHESVAEVLAGLGSLFTERTMLDEAEAHLQQALEIYDEVLESGEKRTANVLVSIAVIHVAKFKLADAEPLFQRALSICRSRYGTDHPDFIPMIGSFALFNAFWGRFDEADSLGRLALAQAERTRGPEHLTTGSGLFVLAMINMAQGKIEESAPLYDSALTIFENRLGPEHSRTGTVLSLTATAYRHLGMHARADSLARRSMAIKEQAAEQESTDMVDGLMTLGSTSLAIGRYAEAESLYVKALEIAERVCEPGGEFLSVAPSNLAALLTHQARYAEAESLLERALTNSETSEGSAKAHTATVLNNLGNLYAYQGRYDESVSMLKQSLAVIESTFGEDHLQMAVSLQNIASVLYWQRKYADAEQAAKRSLDIHERVHGSGHEDVASVLDVLGALATVQGKLDDAESLFGRSQAIREKVLGPEHPHVAFSIDNLVKTYAYQGRYDEATALHEKAAAIRLETLGSEHPDLAIGLEIYSMVHGLSGNWTKALTQSREAFHVRRKSFEDNGHSLAETDALSYSKRVRASADRHFSLYFDSKTADAGERTVTSNIVLSSKGQVSDMIFDRRKPLVNETDPTILAVADSLRTMQFQLAALFVNGPGNDTTDRYRNQIDSFQNLADEIESDLASMSASFRRVQERKEVNLERVVSHLPERAVLIEYFKYNHFIPLTDSIEPRYAVSVFSHDSTPEIISLGRAPDIDRSISAYRYHMMNVSNLSDGPSVFDVEDYRSVCQPLYKTIWQPIEEFVEGKELILVAPDGGLNMISFAGLSNSNGKYLVEDHTIHHLSSGRDLIRLADDPEPASGLFAMGDPDYDALSVDEESESGNDGNRTRNIRSGCGELQDLQVTALPGTRKEVEQLISSWQASTDEPVMSYYGKDASEDHFKSDAPGHRIVHLATHGFFLERSCNPDMPSSGIGSSQGFAGENPLLLSGLLFAGANGVGSDSGSVNGEDAILTAYEVSSMDLTGTELVVLSACETGLGEVESGEGVYGLRRAFQMAGASSVISALWQIPDDATAEMMSRLYSGGGESLAESMKSIQIEKIEELRNENKSDHPYSWGAFIALGDWRW